MDPNEYKIYQTAKTLGKDDAFIKGAIQAYRSSKSGGTSLADQAWSGVSQPPKKPTFADINANDPVTQVGIGAGKSLVDHLQSLGNLIAKPLAAGIDKLTLPVGKKPQPVGFDQADLEQTNLPQKIGGGLETAAEVLVPGGLKTASVVADRIAAGAGKKALEYALSFAAPKVTPALEEAALKRGTQGVTEGGLLKKAQIVATPRTNAVADAINGIVDPAKSDLQNIDLINQHVARTNDAVKSYILENKTPFNQAQLRATLAATKADHSVIFASDPTAEKTYDALIDEFVSHVGSKDTLGLFEARQSFDKIPAVKKLLDGLKGAEGENLRRQAVLDIRGAANNYIADLLPEGNPYKPFMQKETRMIEAVGNAAEKMTGNTINKNAVQSFLKKNPYIGPILKYAIPSGIVAAGADSVLRR